MNSDAFDRLARRMASASTPRDVLPRATDRDATTERASGAKAISDPEPCTEPARGGAQKPAVMQLVITK